MWSTHARTFFAVPVAVTGRAPCPSMRVRATALGGALTVPVCQTLSSVPSAVTFPTSVAGSALPRANATVRCAPPVTRTVCGARIEMASGSSGRASLRSVRPSREGSRPVVAGRCRMLRSAASLSFACGRLASAR